MSALHTYLSQDRLRALSRGETLPDRTTGAALFADISGFTPLTEKLTQELGQRRGIEELTRQINAVYDALIGAIEVRGGSVISFAGDAMTCWFDGEIELRGFQKPLGSGLHAVSAALQMQATMSAFPQLGLKVAVTSGPARRFAVGDPAIQLLDTIAGATIARLATAEHLAARGEVVIDTATAAALADAIQIREWRTDPDTGEQFAVIQNSPLEKGGGGLSQEELRGFQKPLESVGVDLNGQPPLSPFSKGDAALRPWILPAIYEREQSGHGSFLTELRPAVALFLRFIGLDYDGDAQAGEKLDGLMRRMQVVFDRYDGTLLDLIIGDKGSFIYAVFGALTAHEDDARRAVKAALELREAAKAIPDLAPVQIGLSRGTMRTGAYGGTTRQTYGVLGDDVNLAARLMQAAAPGEILLSESVYKAASYHFHFAPQPPLTVKGKAAPLTVFTVTDERQHRAIRLQEPHYVLPMVGRQAELQLIRDKLDLTLEGKSQIIGIVGEAGLGKSRLTAEAIRAARAKGFAAYGGACQSDGVNTPYLVWKSVWSAFFDVNPEWTLPEQISLLENELRSRAPGRVQALPLLGVLLNLDIPDNDFTKFLEPKYRQSALYALLEDCLRAAAKDEPILIVIEDLHWIDALSSDLLEKSARALTGSPICFVTVYRPPELTRVAAPRLESMPNAVKIALTQLRADEAAQAVQAKVTQLYPGGSGVVPPELVDKLMTRAQGNPFYLEELLNYLHDRQLDPRDPTALEKIELPDSLHSLILSRIDQLSEQEKTALRVASVIGRLFRADWLVGYYPELGEAACVQANLAQLAEMDITELDSPEPELAYLFKHIVTHEVTYESLPFATRAKLHEQLAKYLETVGVSVDTIAFHYGRSDNQAKKRAYYRMAADAAQAVSAFATAADYLTHLLDLTPADDPTRSALALQLANVYVSLGDFPAARVAIGQAQTAATSDTDRASALAFLGGMTGFLGDYTQAQTILIEAEQLARASGDSPALCLALSALGGNYWRLGKLDDAKAAHEESLELARTQGDVTRELSALINLGTVSTDLDEQERLFTEVYPRAVAMGNRERAMAALNNLGTVANMRQDYATQQVYLQQALALAREIGAQQHSALYLLNLAAGDIELGQLTAARANLREGLALALRLGALPWVVAGVKNFAELAHAEGQTARALALYGLARRQPAWSSDEQRGMDATLTEWALDPSVVEAGMKAGAALDWDTTIQELLKK